MKIEQITIYRSWIEALCVISIIIIIVMIGLVLRIGYLNIWHDGTKPFKPKKSIKPYCIVAIMLAFILYFCMLIIAILNGYKSFNVLIEIL